MVAALHGARVMVTGAGGFIGSVLCRQLAERGAIVHGVSRHAPASTLAHGWQTDLSDERACIDVVRAVRPDVIYHLAGSVTGSREIADVVRTFENNLASTVYLMTAAAEAGVARLLLTGSMEEGVVPDLRSVPSSPYAAAKLGCAVYARLFHSLWGLPVVNLRPAMVYGPGQRDLRKLVPHVMTEFLQGRRPKLSSGQRRADWIYVDDVAEAMIAAATAPGLEGLTLDIGTGALHSVRETVELIRSILKTAIQPDFGALPDRANEIEPAADTTRTRALIGWQSSTPLADGLRHAARWYAEQLCLSSYAWQDRAAAPAR